VFLLLVNVGDTALDNEVTDCALVKHQYARGFIRLREFLERMEGCGIKGMMMMMMMMVMMVVMMMVMMIMVMMMMMLKVVMMMILRQQWQMQDFLKKGCQWQFSNYFRYILVWILHYSFFNRPLQAAPKWRIKSVLKKVALNL